MACDMMRISLALTKETIIPLHGLGIIVSQHAILLIAFVVLALGSRGEVGVAGQGVLSGSLLIAWGSLPLAIDILTAWPWSISSAPILAGFGLTLQVLLVFVALTSAAIIARAKVLNKSGRFTLLFLAVAQVLQVAVQVVSPLVGNVASLALMAYATVPLMFLAAGVALLLFGRVEGLRYRAQLVRENW
jgi:hypothetical protein